MKYVSLVMIRKNLDGVPAVPLPEGYSFREFQAEDAPVWADIETSVGEFSDTEKALKRFSEEFGPDVEEMTHRCLFLMTGEGQAVGTMTAWYSRSFLSGDYGRVHWVAVRPELQGRGLGKALLSRGLRLMARWHNKAYLTTQTTSWVAVRMYLAFDFIPFITKVEEEEGWTLLKKQFEHPALDGPFLRVKDRLPPE